MQKINDVPSSFKMELLCVVLAAALIFGGYLIS
jgi:hypothetical protein